MAVTATHLTTGASGTDASSYDTASVSPSANKLVLATIYIADGAAVATPALTGNGLTWVLVNEVKQDSDREYVAVFRALGSSPSAGVITITPTATVDRCAWSITEFGSIDASGTNGSGAIVQSAVNSGTTGQTSLAVTLAAFSSANNATYGGFGKQTQGATTNGTGFAELGEAEPGDGFGTVQSQWRNDNDTSVDWSFGSSSYPMGVAVEIKFGTGVVAQSAYSFFM